MTRHFVRRFTRFGVFLSLILTLPAAAADLPWMPSMLGNGEDNGPVVRSNPDYPPAALAGERDGWVLLSYGIALGGGTEDVIALRSSDAVFEEPSIKAVSRWKYALPAEGQGARGGTGHTSIRFNLDATNGRTAFMSMYEGVDRLLESGDFEEALARLPRAYERIQTLADDAMYHWLVYRIASANGSRLVAADALDSMEPVFDFISTDVLIPALQARIELALGNGELRRARNYIDWARANDGLKSSALYAEFMRKVDEGAAKLAERLVSPEPVTIAARNFHPYWTHSLSYHEFALGEVQSERVDEQGQVQRAPGELKGVQVRCSNARVQHVDVLIDSGYKLPDAWENCLVIVEAEPGTTFTLTEFPPEPAPAQ